MTIGKISKTAGFQKTLTACFLFAAAGAACYGKTGDVSESWTFDISGDAKRMEWRFPSHQSPVRVAELNPAFVTGVPGVEKQGLWCAPGAAGRIASAMILPRWEDFTLTFCAGFPTAPVKRVTIASNLKMRLFFTPDGAFTTVIGKTSVTARASVADGKWHHYALMRRGNELTLWIDGVKQAARTGVTESTYDVIVGLDAQWKFLSADNTDRLFFDELFIYKGTVAPDTLRAFAARAAAVRPPAVTPETERIFFARARRLDPPFATEEEYVPLTIGKDERRPFAEQHDVSIWAVPWFDKAGRDLICLGSIFGSRPLLYRFLRYENGAPVYAEGVPYTGPSPRGTIPRTDPDGTFGFYRVEVETPAKGKERRVLAYHRFDRVTRTFGARQIVLDTHGRPYGVPGGKKAFGDLDGDGVDDLLIGRACPENGPATGCNGGFPWPKKGNCPWTEVETPYSGIGRGYDVFGRWLGAENVMEVLWAKGIRADDGTLRFAAARPVYVDMPDFPHVKRALTWKMYMNIMGLATYGAPSGRHLVLFGDMNRIASFHVSRVEAGDVYCGLPRPLLASGYTAPHNYWLNRIQTVDLDGDGRKELLLDGNPGTVGVLKGVEPGSWTSARAMIQGGAICGETLSAPTRFDWDRDGRADILLTDASGWMTFWGGTDDPLVYRGARPFTVNGKPFCLKGGDSGSLQGKVERVWGYVKIIAGRWGDADALITTDICGDLLLHRRAAGDDPLALVPAQPFRHPDGRPFKVAWRSRPDFVPAGFAGVPRPSLLIMDLEGDAAVAVPEADGSLVLAEVRKLAGADGKPIRLCGMNGLWGRGHLECVDWDGDGKDDIVFGTNQTCQKYFCKLPIKVTGTPFLYKNIGTQAEPRFAEPTPFRFTKSGNRLAFGCHNATPWATDLDGDGRPDLLVSAENGKVYAFRHDEISSGETP